VSLALEVALQNISFILIPLTLSHRQPNLVDSIHWLMRNLGVLVSLAAMSIFLSFHCSFPEASFINFLNTHFLLADSSCMGGVRCDIYNVS
jgi:hypothetical protein